jgi:energy-coupling factor transport system ATP-binding protein
MTWVEILDFSYTYPGETSPALKNISISLECGSFTVITGRSGSGKSTLGKALAGFLFQDEEPKFQGKIIINETDMAAIPLFAASERVAYVQQNPEDQFCTLTVADEIAFGLENKNIDPLEIERRIDLSLEIVKGEALKDRYLANLSGGEKQKIAIASMLALFPDVLILDEPTSNLDPEATQNIFNALHHMRDTHKMTVIIIEHKLSQLTDLELELIVLENGEILPIKTIEAFQWLLEQDGLPYSTAKHIDLVSQEEIIQIKNLNINLNGKTILQDFTLDLKRGQLIALMGPNGSGKSTLLQSIMGFFNPTYGSVIGFGRNLLKEKTTSLVKNIGFIFQNPDHQLFTNSVFDEATLTIMNLDLLTPEAVHQTHLWLQRMHLDGRSDDHPQRLSYGEKRRLNLLAIILHQPELLLIDEFLIGQDRGNATHWMRFFRDYADQGNCVLLVNHHMELTKLFCDRIIFLDEGHIITDKPTDEAISSIENMGYEAFMPKKAVEVVHA